MQALYDELTTQAACMIEYPSDYQFRLHFMLMLHPEILDYIIKTHCISAEQSTIAEICAAYEDFECSQEYGRQLATLQSHNNVPHASVQSKPSWPSGSSMHRGPSHKPGHATTCPQNAQSQTRPAGKEMAPARHSDAHASTLHDSKGKFTPRSLPREGASKGNCYNCGRPGHFSKDCPSPPKAKGYAARLEEGDEAYLEETQDTSEQHYIHPQDEEMVIHDGPDIDPEDDAGPLGDQYSSENDDNLYPFSDKEGLLIQSRAVRVIPLEAEDEVNAHVTRASKPEGSKPKVIESNCA
jgi:hypothetical protein